MLYVVRCVLCVVCCAECGVLCIVYCVLCIAYCVFCVVCCVLCVVCCMLCVVRSVVCGVCCVLCIVYCVLCVVCILCGVQCAFLFCICAFLSVFFWPSDLNVTGVVDFRCRVLLLVADPRPRSVVTVSQRVADISPKNPSLASMPSPAPKPARGGEPPVVGKSPTARGASGSGEAATAELGLPPGAVKTLRKSNNIGLLGRLPEGSGTGRRRSGSLQRSVSSVQDEEAAMQRVSAALERVDATLAAMRSSTGVSAAVRVTLFASYSQVPVCPRKTHG